MNSEGAKVIPLKRPKRYSLDEAKELLPRVREFTRMAVEETAPWIERLQQESIEDEELRQELSEKVEQRINAWADDIATLGALPKGLWLVDFDTGNGYYCWRWNEEEIGFFHTYEGGFGTRTPIQ